MQDESSAIANSPTRQCMSCGALLERFRQRRTQVETAEAVTFGEALVDRMYFNTEAEAILEVR